MEENNSFRKKDLTHKLILEDSEVSDDEDIVLFATKEVSKKTKNKEVARKKEGKKEYKKEANKDMKKDKINCQGCNRSMQNECSNKKDENGKKVLQVYISDDKSISEDEDLSEY